MSRKQKKIRVLHIISRIYPYSGMERKVIQLLNRMDRNIFETHLVSLTDIWGEPKDYLKQDVRLYSLNKNDGVHLELVFRLADILKKNKIHIIHSHNWATLFYAVIAAHLAKVPIIIHGEHGRETKKLDQTFKRNLLRKILYALTNQIVVVAKDLENMLINRFKINRSKLKLIINGVDFQAFQKKYNTSKTKQKYAIEKNTKVIATIATLRPVKDILTLIRSFKLILDQVQDVNLLIAGSFIVDNNPYQKEVVDLIKKYNIQSQVQILGRTDNIPEFLSIVDVYVNSSISEGMSNTILEAMASGVPIVASRVGGNPELVIDGKTGFLFGVQNPEDCASKVLKILGDPKLKEEFGRHSRDIIFKKFSLEEMVWKNQTMYKELYSRRLSFKY